MVNTASRRRALRLQGVAKSGQNGAAKVMMQRADSRASNDKAVLGPWGNGRWVNLFTGVVIAMLVMLSSILTAAVVFPDIGETMILLILGIGTLLALAMATAFLFVRHGDQSERRSGLGRATGRMWPLGELAPKRVTSLTRTRMMVLCGYLVVAGGLVLVRIVALATGTG